MGTVHLPPAPRSLEALGRNHTLEAAVAELVDNSIDARAGQVFVRFVQESGRLIQIVVVDDGRGMTSKQLDVAMTVGGHRDYEHGDIGKFGFGLKAASFSQASTMTVISRHRTGGAGGRRWIAEEAKRDYACQIVDPNFAEEALLRTSGLAPASSGTVVIWDDVKGFPTIGSESENQRFLQDAFRRMNTHFGLVYHRLLEANAVRIWLDVDDREYGPGQRILVQPIDPVGYPRTGSPGWPKALQVGDAESQLTFDCHIWPGRSTLDQFRLDGNLIARQGLYVYLRDRLIQRGGWNGLVHEDKQLNLARVAIDVPGDVDGVLSIKPEKNGIETGPRFAHLVHEAITDDGHTFADYLNAARGTIKEANRRVRTRKARLPAGPGFDPTVRRAIKREVPIKNEDALSIRWAPLGSEQFFRLDPDEPILWLNKRYRTALLGSRAAGLNDLPLLKTLLYLIFEDLFAGQHHGPREKDNLELWQALLTTAAKAEL